MKFKRNNFEIKLRRKTRPLVFFQAARGFLFTFFGTVVFFYAAFVLAAIFPQGILFPIPPEAFIGGMTAVPLAVALAFAYLERRDTRRLTLKLESHYPQLRDRLLTVVELSGKSEALTLNPFSQILAESLESEMGELMERFNFRGAASFKKLWWPALFLLILIATGTVHALVQPEFFLTGYSRLTQSWRGPEGPSRNFSLPDFKIEVIPGDAKISRGSNLVIQAATPGYTPKQVALYLKKSRETGWQVFPMEKSGERTFQVLLTHVMQPSLYYVKADHEESAVFRIELYETLRMERALWNIRYPSYTHLRKENRQGWGGKWAFPKGTRLHLELSFNQPVRPGEISVRGQKAIPLRLKTPEILEASFNLSSDLNLTPRVQSQEESWLEAPAFWIQVLPDLAPYLEVLEPQLQNYVFPTQEVPFQISVNDDYGLRSVALVIRYRGKEERIEWLPKGKMPESIVLKPVLRLEGFQLHSRDLVFAYVEARDNYPANDPAHTVKSPLFAFLIRDYLEQYKINLPKSSTPSVRSFFEDILADEEKVMLDTWDYISDPPREGPAGWEIPPPTEKDSANG